MSFAKRYLARHRASRCLWTGLLPGAVSQRGPAGGEEAAATAWYAEPVVPFFCSTFGDGLARVGVRKDGFIVIAAEFTTDELVEATIEVGLGGVLYRVGERSVDHVAGCPRPFRDPVPEARPEPMRHSGDAEFLDQFR